MADDDVTRARKSASAERREARRERARYEEVVRELGRATVLPDHEALDAFRALARSHLSPSRTRARTLRVPGITGQDATQHRGAP